MRAIRGYCYTVNYHVTLQLVSLFIASQLDYCNSLLTQVFYTSDNSRPRKSSIKTSKLANRSKCKLCRPIASVVLSQYSRVTRQTDDISWQQPNFANHTHTYNIEYPKFRMISRWTLNTNILNRRQILTDTWAVTGGCRWGMVVHCMFCYPTDLDYYSDLLSTLTKFSLRCTDRQIDKAKT